MYDDQPVFLRTCSRHEVQNAAVECRRLHFNISHKDGMKWRTSYDHHFREAAGVLPGLGQNLDAEKKFPVFLTITGKKGYLTLRSLLLSQTPTEADYKGAKKRHVIHCCLFVLPDGEITWHWVDKGATIMEAAQDMVFDNSCASDAELH
ncbi:hypothetical protein MRX96_050773 [Rhipicephalus microplus]